MQNMNCFKRINPLTFTDVPSVENNNKDYIVPMDDNSTINNNVMSNVLNREVTTVTKDKEFDKVSPKRAKLRKESHKHMIKKAQHIIKRVNLKGESMNVGNIV